jgi:hypothetical protein
MSEMSACERIKHYRDLAQEIRSEAKCFESAVHWAFLVIAENWEILAAEVERRAFARLLN